jgi:CO dehydrogenase nickel-insertion accessory protein CooC1
MFIKNSLSEIEFLGSISFNNDIMESDIKGLPSYETSQQTIDEVIKIKKALEATVHR